MRIHGRGGQGVVTASELVSAAAFAEGHHAQGFPTFGSERAGAPVVSFCRIDDEPIRSHEPLAEPDAVIIQASTLLHQVRVFEGLVPDGYVLINSSRTLSELGLEDLLERYRPERLRTVPASAMAKEHVGRALPNAALLGGFAALTGVLALESVQSAIRDRFRGPTGDRNAAAARAAHDYVLEQSAGVERAGAA